MTNIVVPELGESVVEARVARWLKNEGEQVSAGEALVELETEKIDLEVSADRAGVLTSIKHPAGADVKVGEVLALLDPSKAAAAPAAASDAKPRPRAAKAAPAAGPKSTPTARNIAREHDVKLEAVPASGPRVTKQDVREFVAGAAAAPAAASTPPPAAAKPAPAPRRRAARPANAPRSGCA